MVKTSLSSLELAALVLELQFLVKGKISQIYHQEEELLWQLHVPGKGKLFLKIIPGKWLCLTDQKNPPLKPTSFCMQLRKYLDNAVITGLYQEESERIVMIELEKKEKFFLIIEFFAKGNIVLADNEGMIIAVLNQQMLKARTVKPGEKYLFPRSPVNWKSLSENELEDVLHHSDKKNLAVSLATDIGLGGRYAEEICAREGIDKNKKPSETTKEEIKKMLATIVSFQREIENHHGFIYDDQTTPFPLKGKTPLKETATYNEAIDLLQPFKKKSLYEKKIHLLKRRIEEQEEALKKLEENIIENKIKGEKMYEYYGKLQRLLEIVEELRKTKSWQEIERELKKERNIKKVNLKEKTVLIAGP